MPSINLQFHPPVIAHRGANRLAPENTLSAFRLAKTLGVQWVEFDVMLAACGETVIIHDETVDRTTNGKGRVIDFPYNELKKLDAGSWFNPAYAHEKIPTLRETLVLLQELKLAANIEIKALVGHEVETVNQVFRVLYEMEPTIPILVTSFSVNALRHARKIAPKIYLGHLMDSLDEGWEIICDELNCAIVDLNQEILTKEIVLEVKKSHRLLLSFTVNEKARAEQLFSWGVDAVFSDCPDVILNKS